MTQDTFERFWKAFEDHLRKTADNYYNKRTEWGNEQGYIYVNIADSLSSALDTMKEEGNGMV